MDIQKLKTRLERHSNASVIFFIGVLWLTLILMAIIIISGIFTIGVGIYDEIWRTNKKGLIEILHGIELIFVSPLPHLIITSFSKYLSATRLEVGTDLKIKKDYIRHSILEITNAKIFTIGLFISLLFLHAIDLVLQKELDMGLLIYVLPLIAMLIIFYFLLDKESRKLGE